MPAFGGIWTPGDSPARASSSQLEFAGLAAAPGLSVSGCDGASANWTCGDEHSPGRDRGSGNRADSGRRGLRHRPGQDRSAGGKSCRPRRIGGRDAELVGGEFEHDAGVRRDLEHGVGISGGVSISFRLADRAGRSGSGHDDYGAGCAELPDVPGGQRVEYQHLQAAG